MPEGFVLPDFLNGNDANEIQERMMKNLPSDIDDMPGGFPYDFTMPTALVQSELLQYYAPRLIQMIFPEHAWGEWLDYHAAQVGIKRRDATQATGLLQVTGKEGSEIPSGSVFYTPATSDGPAINFQTTAAAQIDVTGTAMIPIKAVAPGSASNVIKGTITMAQQPGKDITAITNPEPVIGGTDIESDESLRENIKREYNAEGRSFIGNDADYIRWATSQEGVGGCSVASDSEVPGVVKLILIDEEGGPVNEETIERVRNHILSPNDRSKRLMPTGSAVLEITTPKKMEIDYAVTGISFDETITSLELIKETFAQLLKEEYIAANQKHLLRYNHIRPLLSDIPGIIDFEEFTMNGGEANIVLDLEIVATTNTISLSRKEAVE
jgi:uncharacterized phage protein gp47/JayE